MGLKEFETEGPRTYSSKTKQKKLDGSVSNEFEDEWGVKMIEARDDPEFFKKRFEEGKSVGDLCSMFHWLPTSVVSKLSEFVQNDELDPEIVPEVDEERYNDKPIAFYLEECEQSRNVTEADGNGKVENQEQEEKKTGLESFIS